MGSRPAANPRYLKRGQLAVYLVNLWRHYKHLQSMPLHIVLFAITIIIFLILLTRIRLASQQVPGFNSS
jgi:hypothetical protein